MPQFFMGREIFAWVIAFMIMIACALYISSLPVAMYPDFAPPTVVIS